MSYGQLGLENRALGAARNKHLWLNQENKCENGSRYSSTDSDRASLGHAAPAALAHSCLLLCCEMGRWKNDYLFCLSIYLCKWELIPCSRSCWGGFAFEMPLFCRAAGGMNWAPGSFFSARFSQVRYSMKIKWRQSFVTLEAFVGDFNLPVFNRKRTATGEMNCSRLGPPLCTNTSEPQSPSAGPAPSGLCRDGRCCACRLCLLHMRPEPAELSLWCARAGQLAARLLPALYSCISFIRVLHSANSPFNYRLSEFLFVFSPKLGWFSLRCLCCSVQSRSCFLSQHMGT